MLHKTKNGTGYEKVLSSNVCYRRTSNALLPHISLDFLNPTVWKQSPADWPAHLPSPVSALYNQAASLLKRCVNLEEN